MTMYRLSWEHVNLSALWLFSNANPALYKNTTQTVPNSQIPDEHWHPVSKETDNPFAQHDTLKRWADADTGFVRNVVLEKAVSEPRWEVIDRGVNAHADGHHEQVYDMGLGAFTDSPTPDNAQEGQQ